MSPTRLPTQPQHRFETVLAPELARVSDARRSASAVLRLWDVGKPLADDVQLVVSELVANAMEHGSGWVALRFAETAGNLTVEVTDANHVPARMRCSKPDDPRGRGLVIVAALAQKWGVSENGRTTWARFILEGTAMAAAD
ncbi:ATP-binding protein [Streptomyces pseudogriseolus]|uniref:ATP-binding protein n=1 Tax=Streptomyces pseudogriseolus TaxID=36817 RepID=UPI003FA1C962|nr:ATP-binding protein [Streptomyces pseudogriseolus]